MVELFVMVLKKTEALELADVTFGTTGTRRKTRPNITSVNTNKHLLQFLGWMLQIGRPDPKKWYQRHLIDAVSASANHTSSAARKYMELAASIAPELEQVELLELRAKAINCYTRDRQLKALMLRHPHWRPEIEVIGDMPIPSMQNQKRPIVFWTDNTVFGPLIGRMAVHQIGFRPTQFSDHAHGDGYTWLGKFTLQRMIFALEKRYTASRIVSGPTTHYRAMRKLAEVAKNGTPIFMNNNAFIGQRFSCTKLNDQVSFVQATAPMVMARYYDAEIVPLTVLETKPFEKYSVQFHRPLKANMSLSRDDDIKRMALLSTQRQLSEIRKNPEQWLCWTSGQFAQPIDGKLDRPAM